MLHIWNDNSYYYFTPVCITCIDNYMPFWSNNYTSPGFMLRIERPCHLGIIITLSLRMSKNLCRVDLMVDRASFRLIYSSILGGFDTNLVQWILLWIGYHVSYLTNDSYYLFVVNRHFYCNY